MTVTTTFSMRAPPPPFWARLLTAEVILGLVVASLPAVLAFVGARAGRRPRFPRAAVVLALFPIARGVSYLRRARDVIERVDVGDHRCALRLRRRDDVIEHATDLATMTVTLRRVPRAGGDLRCVTVAAPGGIAVRQYVHAGVWEEGDLRALYAHLAPRVGRARERVGEGWFGA